MCSSGAIGGSGLSASTSAAHRVLGVATGLVSWPLCVIANVNSVHCSRLRVLTWRWNQIVREAVSLCAARTSPQASSIDE